MVTPRGHGGHELDGLPLGLVAGKRGVLVHRPLDHSGEAILERLQRAVFIGAVLAVGAGLNGIVQLSQRLASFMLVSF